MSISFEQFMAMDVPAKSSVVASDKKIKGVPLIDEVITYKSNKGESKVYMATVDDHFINVYENGKATGEQKRVIDLWVYPESAEAHFKNAQGEEKAYKPCLKVKEYLDLQLKKIPFISFEMDALTVENVKAEVADFIKSLSHMGVKVSEIKDENKKVVGYKTCMIKLRVTELADGKYGLKVLKSMPFKRG